VRTDPTCAGELGQSGLSHLTRRWERHFGALGDGAGGLISYGKTSPVEQAVLATLCTGPWIVPIYSLLGRLRSLTSPCPSSQCEGFLDCQHMEALSNMDLRCCRVHGSIPTCQQCEDTLHQGREYWAYRVLGHLWKSTRKVADE
jgi:hypothetical protein